MEEKLVKWATSIIGGSIVLPVLLLLVTFAISKTITGEIKEDPFLLKAIAIAILYSISMYLLATLPRKNIRRRIVSWSYSIIFHGGLLIYLGFFTKLGSAIFVLGFVEVLVLVFSAIGLGILIFENRKIKSA